MLSVSGEDFVSQNPSVSKSNRLHVDSTGSMSKKTSAFFIELGYTINFSKVIDNFLKALNFNGYFSNSTGSPVTTLDCLISVGHDLELHVAISLY